VIDFAEFISFVTYKRLLVNEIQIHAKNISTA